MRPDGGCAWCHSSVARKRLCLAAATINGDKQTRRRAAEPVPPESGHACRGKWESAIRTSAEPLASACVLLVARHLREGPALGFSSFPVQSVRGLPMEKAEKSPRPRARRSSLMQIGRRIEQLHCIASWPAAWPACSMVKAPFCGRTAPPHAAHAGRAILLRRGRAASRAICPASHFN